MSAAPVTTDQWLAAAKTRRTVYFPAGTSKVSDERVEEILKEVLSFAPSSFNVQSARVTLALGEKHKELWDIVLKEAKSILPEKAFTAMEGFFTAHKNAYASVVFWESEEANNEMAKKKPSAAPLLPQYSEHSTGMLQILVWTSLELEGLGANLQHMQAFPGVEAAWRKVLDLPEDFKLKANLNYGDATVTDGPPEKLPYSTTLKVVK